MKAEEFLTKYFHDFARQKSRGLYKQYGAILYVMYRHGLAHCWEPKQFVEKFTNNDFIVQWLIGKTDQEIGKLEMGDRASFVHLTPSCCKGSRVIVMPISTRTLFKDLLLVIDGLIKEVEQDKKLSDKRWEKWKQLTAPEDVPSSSKNFKLYRSKLFQEQLRTLAEANANAYRTPSERDTLGLLL